MSLCTFKQSFGILPTRSKTGDHSFTSACSLRAALAKTDLNHFPVGLMAVLGTLPAHMGHWLSYGEDGLQKGPSLHKPVRIEPLSLGHLPQNLVMAVPPQCEFQHHIHRLSWDLPCTTPFRAYQLPSIFQTLCLC